MNKSKIRIFVNPYHKRKNKPIYYELKKNLEWASLSHRHHMIFF